MKNVYSRVGIVAVTRGSGHVLCNRLKAPLAGNRDIISSGLWMGGVAQERKREKQGVAAGARDSEHERAREKSKQVSKREMSGKCAHASMVGP